jgi:hypothetical protein
MSTLLLGRPSCFATALIFSAFAIWQGSAAAQGYPRAPETPTFEDCRHLSVAYYDVTRRIHREIGQCMRSRPRFGYGSECSLVSPHRVHLHTLRAWVQCDQYEAPLCEAYRLQEQETRLCQARANQRARVNEEGLAAMKRATSLAEALGKGWNTTRNLLANPAEFFFKGSMATVTKAAFPGWRGDVDISSDPRAQELYRFLQQQTWSGTNAVATNPVVRAIQKESLTQILAHFKRLQLQLNSATDQIEKFSMDQQTSVRLSQPSPSGATRPDNSHRPIQSLCQTLGTC